MHPEEHMGKNTVDEHFRQHGIFSWNELMTPDLDKAKAFYGEIFGWTFTEEAISDGPMAGQPYVVAHVGDTMAAGMLPLCSSEVPPNWGSYVTVDNLAETLAKVEQLGGTIIVPGTPVKDIGQFAVIQDNSGAFLMLMEIQR